MTGLVATGVVLVVVGGAGVVVLAGGLVTVVPPAATGTTTGAGVVAAGVQDVVPRRIAPPRAPSVTCVTLAPDELVIACGSVTVRVGAPGSLSRTMPPAKSRRSTPW